MLGGSGNLQWPSVVNIHWRVCSKIYRVSYNSLVLSKSCRIACNAARGRGLSSPALIQCLEQCTVFSTQRLWRRPERRCNSRGLVKGTTTSSRATKLLSSLYTPHKLTDHSPDYTRRLRHVGAKISRVISCLGSHNSRSVASSFR